jgi:hypothetical protein
MSTQTINEIDTLTIIEWLEEYKHEPEIKEALLKEYSKRRQLKKEEELK